MKTIPNLRLLALAACFAFASICSPYSASAIELSKCREKSDHDSISLIFVDVSEAPSLTGKLPGFIETIAEMIQPGERVVAGVISDRKANAEILLDMVKPKGSMWESQMKIRAKKKKFNECMKSLQNSYLAGREDLKNSAILETFTFVHQLLSATAAQSKRVFLYSDMVQNSDSFSFYKRVPNAEKTLEKSRTEGLVMDLSGVEVLVAGTGQNMSDKQARAIEDFWRLYFKESKAKLAFFGPVLLNL